MKKSIGYIILAVVLLITLTAGADFILPGSLTVIEPEAFMSDASLRGVLSLPDRVEQIGDHAFSQTELYALIIPSQTKSVGYQALNHAAYVRVGGVDTVLSGLSGVKYIIGKENSEAGTYAANASLLFVPETQLVEFEGFYYQRTKSGLHLLSAVNNAQIKETISVPAQIGDEEVTGISSFAFLGCYGLKTIHLPQSLSGNNNIQSAIQDCPGVHIIIDLDGPAVRSVSANVTSGSVGDSIIWTVDAISDSPIANYLYTLQKDGETIDTLQSNASTYTQVVQSVGAYKLNVEITDADGRKSRGSSSELYIAVESMVMTVPETLVNGEDLEIQIMEVADALRYSVYLTNETTGEYMDYRTLTEPGKVTFDGYLLDEGIWRISGYVYGNNFRYSVPTVQRVTVTGAKETGPEIAQYDPITYGTGNNSVRLRLSETEPYAVKYQCRYSDGTLSTEWMITASNDDCWIYPEGDYEKWQDGGSLLLRGAIKRNGVWTAWGPVTEVTVLSAPKLETPELTAPETAQAGKDLTVSFTSVEHGNWYNLYISEGYDPEQNEWYGAEDDYPFFKQYTKRGSVVIPGYYLSAGVYTLRVMVWSEDAYRESDWAYQRLEIEGERPTAPQLTPDKKEQCVSGDTLTLSVHADGAEGAYIFCESWRNGRRDGRWSPWSISLDEEGNGTLRQSWSFGDETYHVGMTFRYKATAIVNGVWSEFSEYADVLMIESTPLPKPEVNISEKHNAGEDLTFTFSQVDGAEWYSAELQRAYGDESVYSWHDNACKPGQELTVPGYLLSAGSYRLVVNAYWQDQKNSQTEVIVSVSGSRPESPSVTGYPDEVHIKDRITFAVDSTDADKLTIHYKRIDADGSDYGWNRISLEPTGETTSWSFQFDDDTKESTFTFQFSVRRNGVWSAWRTVEMTVQDLPPLNPVTIHAQESYEAGEDVTFTYDSVEDAESYEWHIYSAQRSWGYSSERTPAVHTISGYELESGTYTIHITAQSESHGSSNSEFVFKVTGSKAQAPIAEVDKPEVIGNESYTFTIDTSDAEELAYRISSGYDAWYSRGTINVLEDSTRWTTYNGDSNGGIRSYSFAARINDRWTAWSTPILVNALKKEQLAPVTLEIPSTLTVGQDLSVTVGAVENASHMYVYLYNSRGAQVDYKSLNGSSGGSVTIEGYRLLTAGTYTVQAIASRDNARSEAQATLTVTSGNRPEAPQVTPDTGIGRANVSYGFTIDTSDAERTAVRYYRDGNTNDVNYRSFAATGNMTRWEDSKSEAGSIWKYAFAVRENGIWSPWSTIMSVEITNREVLEKPVLSVPESLEAGSDLYLSFTGVEHADSYSMKLTDPNGKTSSWTAYPDMERRVMGYDLIPGTYTVSVTASGADYESSTSVQSLIITGSRSEAPDVIAEPKEVFTNEIYTFSIDTSGGQEIAYRYYYNTSSSSLGTLNVLSDRTIWDTSSSSAGTRRYSFCVFKDNRWSAWSPVIEIVVKARPQLPAPEVTAPETLLLGRNLTVNVSEVEGATEYNVYLYNNRDQQIAYRWKKTAGDFSFQGYLLQKGSFQIKVTVYGANGSSQTTTRKLTVTEAALPASPVVVPPEETAVSPQTYYYFNIQTEGATMAAVRYYRIGSPNDLSMQDFSVSATESTTSWRGYQYSGGNTYAYSFAVLKDGVWSEWSSFIEITIQ